MFFLTVCSYTEFGNKSIKRDGGGHQGIDNKPHAHVKGSAHGAGAGADFSLNTKHIDYTHGAVAAAMFYIVGMYIMYIYR